MGYMMRDKEKTYRFWCELENGNEIEFCGLTKRQAVIRYNKACKDYNMVRCGWEIENAY